MDLHFAPLALDAEMGKQQVCKMVENTGMGPTSPEAWLAVVAAQQRQHAKEHQFESQQFGDCLSQAMQPGSQGNPGREQEGWPAIRIPKMTSEGNTETFLNAFQCSLMLQAGLRISGHPS